MRHQLCAAAVAMFLAVGCHHTRVEFPPNTAARGLEPRSATAWSYLWGLVQDNVEVSDCPSASLSEVTTSTNIGFALLTLATLGCVSAVNIEYRCRAPRPAQIP